MLTTAERTCLTTLSAPTPAMSRLPDTWDCLAVLRVPERSSWLGVADAELEAERPRTALVSMNGIHFRFSLLCEFSP